MTSAVNVNEGRFTQRAKASWGEPSDWVLRLAAEADRIGQRAAAERIGYTDGVVSGVLGARYAGDLAKVEAKVRGALMGLTVTCPVLDEIGRDRCLKEQAMPRSATSALRSRLWHACRDGCPHSLIKVRDDDAA